MPVYRLLEEMTYEELIGWFSYLSRRPIDWRDDERTYRLMQVQGVKEKPENIFQTLKAVYQTAPIVESQINKSFKNSVMFRKLLSATGGVKLDSTL